jgi:two-component system, NarL family, sensor histidine kinase UhpB
MPSVDLTSLEGQSTDLGADHRLLVRLGFDLHDGPLQEVAALSTELHFFREQLALALGERVPAVQSAEELIQRVDTLATHIRELAVSASAPELLEQSLSDALAEAIELWADCCDIELRFEPSRATVDATALTDSQRIAILRVSQGALANVAQHSGAFLTQITLRARLDGIELQILDNGCGFDPGPAQRASEEAGHLGLAGMSRRLELLGGTLTITSRSGGPTCLRAFLPRWRGARPSTHSSAH